MRQAVAPAQNVENQSFAVTDLFKICTHCERLGKKVRERGEKDSRCRRHLVLNAPALMLRPAAWISATCLAFKLFFKSDVSPFNKRAAVQPFVRACLRLKAFRSSDKKENPSLRLMFLLNLSFLKVVL